MCRRGFGENVPVDVVIRPEDLYIFPVSDMAQLTGVVETSIFKGVHYEMTVLCGGYEFLVQDYHHFEVGVEVGLLVKPFDIHIMKKERVCNTFEGKCWMLLMWNFLAVALIVLRWKT